MNKDTVDKIIKFNNDRNWKNFHTPGNLAKSISIESAELLECFQWDEEYDKSHVVEELADVFIYSINMANALNVDIDEIINDKLKINGEKYPIDKYKGTSKKYNK